MEGRVFGMFKRLWSGYDRMVDRYSEELDSLNSDRDEVKSKLGDDDKNLDEELGEEWHKRNKHAWLGILGCWSFVVIAVVALVVVCWLAVSLSSNGPVDVPDAPSGWEVSDLVDPDSL